MGNACGKARVFSKTDNADDRERTNANTHFILSDSKHHRPQRQDCLPPLPHTNISEVLYSDTRQDKQEEQKEIKKLRTEIEKRERTIGQLRDKVQNLEERNGELATRLSALASARLMDGNANIADLSDENRPTKLAEQFSELYDNEWTDAYSCMERSRKKKRSERKICARLLKLLVGIYEQCNQKAAHDLQKLESAVKPFTAGTGVSKEMLKQLKDTRKKLPLEEGFRNEVDKRIRKSRKLHSKRKAVQAFIDKSLTVCWYMAIQDPPVLMDTNITIQDEEFNSTTHKQYTKSGPVVDFLVWPSLYLCKGGNLLSKGVVQCKPERENPHGPGSDLSPEAMTQEIEQSTGQSPTVVVVQPAGTVLGGLNLQTEKSRDSGLGDSTKED